MTTAQEQELKRRLLTLTTLRAVREWHTWVHRRAETLAFASAEALVRTIELQLTVPPELVELNPEVVNVPLALVRKGETSAVRVTDGSGARVPTVTSGESATRAAGLLEAHAATVLAEARALEPNGDLPVWLRDELAAVAGLDAAAAGAAYARLREPPAAGDGGEGRGRAALAGDAALLSLAADLARAELLFAAIPREQAARRRLLRIDYEEDLVRTQSLRRTVAELLGVADTRIVIDAGGLGAAGVSELRLEVPDGVELAQARLLVSGDDAAHAAAHETTGTRAHRRVTVDDAPPGARGVLRVDLRAALAYPLGVLAASLFAAAVLTLGGIQLGALNDEVEAAATLLLAGPALLGALVAQPGRGTPGARLVTLARAAAILNGLMTFLAAGLLAAVPEGACQGTLWWVFAGGAWLLAATVGAGVVAPRMR